MNGPARKRLAQGGGTLAGALALGFAGLEYLERGRDLEAERARITAETNRAEDARKREDGCIRTFLQLDAKHDAQLAELHDQIAELHERLAGCQ